MCGRLTMNVKAESFEREFGLQLPLKFRPSNELTPGQPLLTVQNCSGQLEGDLVTWGVKPSWSSDTVINARSETVLRLPMFHRAIRDQRCVVALGWLEWSTFARPKRPYQLTIDDGDLLLMGGLLVETNEGPRAVILTTNPLPEIQHVHDRMPVLLDHSSWRDWLGPLEHEAINRFLGSTPPPMVIAPFEHQLRETPEQALLFELEAA